MSANKKEPGLRFSIPSVESIQEARRIPADKGHPTLFRKPPAKEQPCQRTLPGPSETTAGTSTIPCKDPSVPSEVRAGPSGARVERAQHSSQHGAPRDVPPTLTAKRASDTQGCDNVHSRGGGGKVTVQTSEAKLPAFPSATPAVALLSSAASNSPSEMASSSSYPSHAIITNIVQKKNPLVKHIRNVPWELGEIVPDFELGRTTCALFLSVKYHSLHPDYIHTRLKELGKQYVLRILLLLVDTTECQKVLHDLTKISILADLTLILAWSNEEAARYLETYKAYENKPPDLLMERVESDFFSRATDSLTTVKKVNKTDVGTLLTTFKTMDKLVAATEADLSLCIDVGARKAKRLHDLFHEPFKRRKKAKLEQ